MTVYCSHCKETIEIDSYLEEEENSQKICNHYRCPLYQSKLGDISTQVNPAV
ncbi:hypothetical protein [Candidatus Uabimicrobium sp. HlEnr_7]|uniref:hypothetical protein n=1 Tax=Candidatus Uabimicrobium helgolandensis TaxID=3095367 RepID=UPI00355680F4